jgi:two-component system, NarL family, sensor histidine kinase UhpB
LHDEAGQLLASVHLALDGLGRDVPEVVPRLDSVKGLLDSIEEELRRLSHELRPTILDDLGLGPALEFLAEGVSARNGFQISIEAMPETRLPARIESVLYRIVQEALNNVSKHARASSVKIRVRHQTDVISCVITDDGRGFDVAATMEGSDGRGIGLIGMRERVDRLGGTLMVNSTPGGGTELVVTIPGKTYAAGGRAVNPTAGGQGITGLPRCAD